MISNWHNLSWQKTIDFFKKNKFKEMSKAMKIKKQELKWSGKKENEIIN